MSTQTLLREELNTSNIDIEERDIIIWYNEPALRYSNHKLEHPDLDAKLSARLPVYFLPTVQIARTQKIRPRLLLTSGVNMALKRSATSDVQRAIMLADNAIKRDFLWHFFERFFYDDFSLIENIVSQDVLKMPDEKLILLRKIVETKAPKKIQKLKMHLAKFKKPYLFNNIEGLSEEGLSEEAKLYLTNEDESLQNAFKYALSHLFALGDVNFEWNYVHNPIWYATIGGHQEHIFNEIRTIAYDMIKDFGAIIFDKNIIMKDNLKIVIEWPKVPPSYNGYWKTTGWGRKIQYDEVTYENKLPITYYNSHPKLTTEIEYLYTFIKETDYKDFRERYKSRYFDLKERHREAYQLPSYW